jgi:pSer/pThr/pTyr-binding forkhead associated (FHA) protein
MRDGLTRKIQAPANPSGYRLFLEKFRASLIVVSGAAEGNEIVIDQRRVTLGRGPGVDLAFDNPSMSQQHAVLEFVTDGFRVSDLESTNGVEVNGKRAKQADLHHGDRFALGNQVFQLLIEKRETAPRTYVLTED